MGREYLSRRLATAHVSAPGLELSLEASGKFSAAASITLNRLGRYYPLSFKGNLGSNRGVFKNHLP